MEYRSLGRTGVRVSALCLGAMNFGDGADERETARIVDRFLDAGGNFIDTANVYARGVSEEFTGKALKANGKRDRAFLATKVHGKMGDGPNDWATRATIFSPSARRRFAGCRPTTSTSTRSIARSLTRRSTRHCARSTTLSAPARCAISEHRLLPPGRSWNRSGR